MKNQSAILEKDVKSQLNALTIYEKRDALNWAIQIRAIQNNTSLSKKQKILLIKKVSNKDVLKNSLQLILKSFKRYWKKASWSQKLAIIGSSGALLTAGVSNAGIAAFGGGIGLPFFLLTAAGGSLIGTIIDTLQKIDSNNH